MNLTENTIASVEVEEAKPKSSGLSAGALALAGAGLLAATALRTSPARAVSPALTFNDIPGSGDIKVLNYALALEDLETELYVQAVQRMTTGGRGGRDAVPGTNISGLGLAASSRAVSISRLFGRVEREHRDFLRAAIRAAGGPVIPAFTYTFGIETMNLGQVLNLLYTIEQGGTNAYIGAVPFFSTKTYVPVAAAIQGTEARHTAIFADILNDELGRADLPSPPPNAVGPGFGGIRASLEAFAQPNDILAVVSPFIVIPTTR